VKWTVGRQHSIGTPYYKHLVFVSRRLRLDTYILKYPTGSKIDWHVDPSEPGYAHHRLNIILNRANGGAFQTIEYKKTITHKSRIIKFRPDVTTHRVLEVTSGTRYVLSIGWLRKIK